MDFGGVPRGRLRVTASDNFGEHYIAPLAAELLDRYRHLEIEVHITSRMIDIVAEGFDLAIMYSNLSSSRLLAQKIFELPHVVAASPEYLSRLGTPHAPGDLKDHNCLAATFEVCTPWRFMEAGNERALEVKGTWRSNSGPALLEAALRGIGVVRLPELYLRSHFESGRWVPLLAKFASAPMPVWAVYPGGRHTSSKVRLFVEYLKRRLLELSRNVQTVDEPVH
jgi:DNA-binding transcriptional LysR family regulator